MQNNLANEHQPLTFTYRGASTGRSFLTKLVGPFHASATSSALSGNFNHTCLHADACVSGPGRFLGRTGRDPSVS